LAAAKGHVRGLAGSVPGGISLIPAAGGEPVPITFPSPPAFDACPAFSPNGQALAYTACGGPEFAPACDVAVQPLDDAYRPRGEARRLTRQGAWIRGVAWSRDGRWIVYGIPGRLWRVPAHGDGEPREIDIAGSGGSDPSTSLGLDRLTFVRGTAWDVDVHRLTLGKGTVPLLDSAAVDFSAEYSPDGRRVAFGSNRGGRSDDDRELPLTRSHRQLSMRMKLDENLPARLAGDALAGGAGGGAIPDHQGPRVRRRASLPY
jgi:Tol biopolymer transport system component